MPITLDIKKDVQEAVVEILSPLFEEIKDLKEKIKLSNQKLLDIEEVSEIVGLAPSTIDKHVRLGIFPRPVYQGTAKKWKKVDILNYIDNLPHKKSSK